MTINSLTRQQNNSMPRYARRPGLASLFYPVMRGVFAPHLYFIPLCEASWPRIFILSPLAILDQIINLNQTRPIRIVGGTAVNIVLRLSHQSGTNRIFMNVIQFLYQKIL
jgi:hypothetical protein